MASRVYTRTKNRFSSLLHAKTRHGRGADASCSGSSPRLPFRGGHGGVREGHRGDAETRARVPERGSGRRPVRLHQLDIAAVEHNALRVLYKMPFLTDQWLQPWSESTLSPGGFAPKKPYET